MSYRLEEWLDEVALRMQAEIDAGVTPQGEQTTARELLGRCGYERRGMLISGRIRGALEDRELHTSPDFRLVGRHEAWERLGVQADRVEFVARLETVRQIRNEVMHFSAEACGPEEIHQLECMARFCRGLIPYGRTDMDGERDGSNA